MPSGDTKMMPPGVDLHVTGVCKALELLVKSRKLTQKQAAAKSGLSVHEVRSLLGKNKTGRVDLGSLTKLVWACEMAPGEFFAALYGFYSEEDLAFLPVDFRRRVTKLSNALEKAGLLPLHPQEEQPQYGSRRARRASLGRARPQNGRENDAELR